MNKRIGVAFSGGGGKGGYQVGVCKALNEFGISPMAVSGTSVGALNGSLYAQGRIDAAERIWRKDNQANVLDLSLDHILLHLAGHAGASLVSAGLTTGASVVKFCSVLATLKAKRRGLFSQKGLLAMMEDAFADQPLSSLTLPFCAAVHDLDANEVEYLSPDGRCEDDARNVLLASSALPGIFDDTIIDGKTYTDGGWFWGLPHKKLDNNPVTPLVKAECSTIILICLNRDDLIERAKFPHTRILPIVPSEDLGGMFDGVMDFSAEGAARRIELGYRDGKKILSGLAKFIENEVEYEKLWQDVLQEEEATKETCGRMNRSGNERVNLKRSINDFNRIVFEDDLEGELTVELPNEGNLLEYANRLLIQKIDRQEMLTLNNKVKDYVDRNSDSASDLQQAALDAVAFLSPTIPQADALSEQGVFGRFWNGITGKNLKLIAQNQKDLAQAQFATLSLMQQLQTKNLITLQFTAAINSKLNVLFSEVASLSEEMNRMTFDTYRSLALVWCKARREIRKDRKRIDALEEKFDCLKWLAHIKVKSWLGTHYHDLSKTKRLVCVVNDFFQITKGEWNDRELLTLEAALHELDLLHEEITVDDFLEESLSNRQFVRRLTENLCRDSGETLEIPLLATARAVRTGTGSLVLPPTTWDARLPAFHFALELLESMQRVGYRLYEGRKLGTAKSALVERLETLRAASEKYNCHSVIPELATLREQIEVFRFTIPLIGSFSAGKSSLLNRYLDYDHKEELLETNVTPTTAVASELHWTDGEERVVERYYDGTSRSYPLSQRRHHAKLPPNLFCREIHLKSQMLSNHPDLVLVDMPGIGSGEKNHDQAIAAYIGRDATAFILCVKHESGTIKESERKFLTDSELFDLELGLVVNHRDDLNGETMDEISGQVRTYSRKNEIDIVALNACSGEMDGFTDMLMRLDAKKDGILHKQFVPAIENIQMRLLSHLRFILNEENLSAEDLKRKKATIMEAIQELEQAFNREQGKLLRDCANSLPDAVAGEVQCAFSGNEFQSLFETAKSGGKVEDRIRGLAGATYQASLAIAARQRFAKTAQELQRYVATADVADGAGSASFDAESLPEVSIGLGKIGLGTLAAWVILGPIGGIIAGLVGWFKKNAQEEELKSKLRGVIDEISKKARAEAAQQLPDMADRFLVALKERLDGILNQHKENIEQLEMQLAENRQQDECRKQEIQEAIRSLSVTTP